MNDPVWKGISKDDSLDFEEVIAEIAFDLDEYDKSIIKFYLTGGDDDGKSKEAQDS